MQNWSIFWRFRLQTTTVPREIQPFFVMGFWTNFAKFINFLKIYTTKNDCPAGDTAVFCNGVLDKFCIKIVVDMQAHFEEIITFFVRKVNKFQKTTVPRGIQPFFSGFLSKFCKTPKNDCPVGDTALFLMVFWTNFVVNTFFWGKNHFFWDKN